MFAVRAAGGPARVLGWITLFVAGVGTGASWTVDAGGPDSEPPAESILRTRGESAAPAPEPVEEAIEEPPPAPPMVPVLDRRAAARNALQWTVSVRAGEYYGSGVIIDTRGFVLTSAHVVEGRDRVRVTFVDGASAWADVVERDDGTDLALLRADIGRRPAAPLGTAGAVAVGEDILAVGSPRKMHFTVSRGMVSYAGRPFNGVHYLQTDVPINVGNSGGPVVDMNGKVVAIMAFILRGSQGLSFAVPIDYALSRFTEHLGPTERSPERLLQAWSIAGATSGSGT